VADRRGAVKTINGGVRVEFWKDIVLHGFSFMRPA
jgi:hypothetical protein